ncbi:PAS domain S-box protein [Deinococcus sp. Arct2-2]|uniref:PAS domain-containing sensor histidine kinase n=1 Tax=Deinococcus sp. Arct2-2 TaxID=2568653 RepID=UPI0010A57710|nr:PAS domain-containing sensor histidine kinase [Deinococcus sp. Arct2-2]THF71200.1 PAS domain S-box protein [Deinococcus sp. Arct2-2]
MTADRLQGEGEAAAKADAVQADAANVAPAWSDVPNGALLAALPDPVVLLHSGGTLHNAAAEALFGPPNAHSDWTAVVDEPAALAAALPRAQAGETFAVPLTIKGAAFTGTLSPAGLVPGHDSEPGGVLLHLRATPPSTGLSGAGLSGTGADPLEEALELLNHLNLGLTVQDRQARILRANTAAQTILGLTLDQLTGRDSLDPRWKAVHPDGSAFPGQDHPSSVALRTGKPVRDVPMGVFTPATAQRESEEWRWLSITALPKEPSAWLPEGGVLTVFSDATAAQRTRGQLHGTEARFRSLVEATSQIVWVSAPDGMLHPPQPDWTDFTGQTDAELAGTGWMNALHPDDIAPSGEVWGDALMRQVLYENEYRVRRKDGVYVPMQARAIPVKNEDGTLREWVGTSSDISAVRAAEARLRDLNATLEARVQERTDELAQITRFATLLLGAAGEGILGLDAGGRNTFANPAAARMLGYNIERLIGADQHALIHHHHADGTPHDPAQCPIQQTIQDGQTRRVEADVFWHAQGHAVPVAYIVTPTQDEAGTVTGAVLMFQDITERQLARAALEDVVADLERSNRELAQFAYVASHDLQEPLRTVGSYADLLARRYQGQLDPRADQYLGFMQEAVGRMQSLIRDLLSFAQIGRNDAPPRAVSLDAVLQEAAQNVQAALRDTGGHLTWDTPGTVLGHSSLLVQLLTNLIGNGLKFHREGVPPQVSVTARPEGGVMRIQVTDNGIGIGPEYQERIFAIFQRLHRREAYPGTGMGLAISRKIAEHHGGTLGVTLPPPDHFGSILTLTLPIPTSPSPSPSPALPL